MNYRVPKQYCGEEWEWCVSRAGLGDACRAAACIKRERRPGAKYLALCDNLVGTGVLALRNFTFIDAVIAVPCLMLTQQLQQLIYNSREQLSVGQALLQAQYVVRYWDMEYSNGSPLYLDRNDLRCQQLPLELPARYIVLQSTTSTTKVHAVPAVTYDLLQDSGLPVVVIGSDYDARRHQVPHWVIDLRGQLTVPEAMWIVACSSGVAAPETWSPLLGTMLGIPSIIGCRNPYILHYGDAAHRDWPDLLHANLDRQDGGWDEYLSRVIEAAKTFEPVAREDDQSRLDYLQLRSL